MSIFGEKEFDVKTLRHFESLLEKNFPFVKKERIGFSLLGREINAFSVGRKDGALFAAVFHAMERTTGAMLMRYIFEKAEEIQKGTFKGHFTAVPMVNPDGVEIALYGSEKAQRYRGLVKKTAGESTGRWQANARGVDINHNFNADFLHVRENEIQNGYVTAGPTRFGGLSPESEPETKALCAFCRKNDFCSVAALHSQGREIYSDFNRAAEESRMIAGKLAALSGYTVSEPEGVAVGGGFKDWFCEHFKKPGFTIETGLGKNPLPPETADTEYPRLKPMLDFLSKSSS